MQDKDFEQLIEEMAQPDDNDLTAYLSSISEDWAYVLKDNAND